MKDKFYKRQELYVRNEELAIVKELSKKYNKKEKLLLEMVKECKKFGYSIEEIDSVIKEFYYKF